MENLDMRDLLITRHGESEFNVRGLINSLPNDACRLTEKGIGEARSLGKHLAGLDLDLCATSQLRRAIHTADIALEGRDIPRVETADRNDPTAGRFELGPAAAVHAWIAEHGLDAKNPDGESQLDALRRYIRAFLEMSVRPDPTVLVVAHGMPVAWLQLGVRLASGEKAPNPPVDFINPGFRYAAPPLHVDRDQLGDAIRALSRYAAQS